MGTFRKLVLKAKSSKNTGSGTDGVSHRHAGTLCVIYTLADAHEPCTVGSWI